MPKWTFMSLPDGFDPTLINEIQEKYGVRIYQYDESSVIESTTAGGTQDVIQDAPFLELPLNILAKIANGLDARSLVALAFSCHELYNFYRQSSRQNKVDVPLYWDSVYVEEDGDIFGCKSEMMPYDLEDDRARMCVDSSLNWPFTAHVRQLDLRGDVLPRTNEILSRMKVKTIHEIKLSDHVEYQGLINLIDEYNVKAVIWEWDDTDERYSENETKALLLKPLERLEILYAESHLLHDIKIPELVIHHSPVDAHHHPALRHS